MRRSAWPICSPAPASWRSRSSNRSLNSTRSLQERHRFIQLLVLAVKPAETDVGDEIARGEFKLLFELLDRQLAGAGEQIGHAELRMRGRQLRIELSGPLQLFDRRLKLAARHIEQAEYKVGFGGAEFPEDLVNQRSPFLNLVVE